MVNRSESSDCGEEIERGDNRVDITPLSPEDTEEPELTGGYLFKRDRTGDGESGFWSGEAGGAFWFGFPLAWEDPSESERTTEQQSYLSGILDELAWALVQSDFTNTSTGRHYEEIINSDSWIDHHILNVLFKNPDAFRLSGYMHKDRDGLIEAGPLWDLDRSSGSNDYRVTEPTRWDATNVTSDTTAYFSWGWYRRMFDDPNFAARYWARWSELLEGELSPENVDGHILEMAEHLAEAAERGRWLG